MKYLYELVNRCPPITDEKIAEMRHIVPVVRDKDTFFYRLQKNGSVVHPRNQAFNWDESSCGEEFTFDELNQATIVTQHCCPYLFKPSLDEVYAAILSSFGDEWRRVRFFELLKDTVKNFGRTTDYYAECRVFGGARLVRGEQFLAADGSIGYSLVTMKCDEKYRIPPVTVIA